jgi:UDP-N-acetylglucosamine/UDP-N-acetylgalactosamine diphosphorylase
MEDHRFHETKARYQKYNQSHVLEYYAELSTEEKGELLNQLQDIQVEKLSGFLNAAKKEQHNENATDEIIRPFSGKVVSTISDESLMKSCQSLGMQAIQNNSVAALLLAGGQGTRLGFHGPKGMYDIGLPSGKTLFELIALKIKKLIELAEKDDGTKVRLPLYVMTSPMNHNVTEEYFLSNDYFGLPSEDVIFFAQGVLPCLTPEGKIMMELPFKCAMAPDGNGGIYPAMERCGVLSDMASRDIEHIHVFAIDNALVKPADPTFIGYCIQQNADCGNKVLWKTGPHEKVGVIAEKGGKPCIVEYSDLSTEMAEQTCEDGKLVFGAGNICNHYYTVSFIQNQVLPNMGNMYHVANKKIGIWNEEESKSITPPSNNGIKLESFIFDVFPLSKEMAILEVERASEFGPVKNAPGSATDSPDTARLMMSTMVKGWMLAAGANFVSDGSELCEISPSVTYDGEGLEKYKDKEVTCPFSI